MKRNLLAILIAASLAACNSKEKKDVAQELLPLNNSNLYKSSILNRYGQGSIQRKPC
ncbi:MAG: hypothetical protein V9E88_12200 [Ferruginibacter sp.]